MHIGDSIHEILSFTNQSGHQFCGVHNVVAVFTEMMAAVQKLLLELVDVVYTSYGSNCKFAKMTVYDNRLSIRITDYSDSRFPGKFMEIALEFGSKIRVFDIVD